MSTSAKSGAKPTKVKALKKKTAVTVDEVAKTNFDAYIKSVQVKKSARDKWCEPVEVILGADALKSYAAKVAFVKYALKELTEEKIKTYVEDYGTAGDEKLTNRYEEIRDYLIIRREAAKYTKKHEGALDANMKAFLKKMKIENKKFGPAVGFVPNGDEEMMDRAKEMKKAGWIDTIHTNDTTESLTLENLPDEKMPERVFILGHGSPGTPFLHVASGHFDGKQIAQMLIDQGLPTEIRQIEVLTCFGAKGTKKKLLTARGNCMESAKRYEAAKVAYEASAEDKVLKEVMTTAEKAQTKAQTKYNTRMADPDNFYTVKVSKPAEFEAWNIPFVAALIGHLKGLKNDTTRRKFTHVHVTAYTAPFKLYYNKSQIRYFDLTGIKKEGFISQKREHSDPKIEKQVEVDEKKTEARVYVEPVGPVQLKNGEWIDANADIRKIWT